MHNPTSLNIRSLASLFMKMHKPWEPQRNIEKCRTNLSNRKLIRHAERSSN